MTATVADNPAEQRFELREDGHTAFAAYRLEGDRIIFNHTVVPPELGGRGVGSRLVAAALDQAKQRGLTIVPVCSFVQSYLTKHPEAAPRSENQ